MRAVLTSFVLLLALGCGRRPGSGEEVKGSGEANEAKPANPTPTAFDPKSAANSLAWLAGKRRDADLKVRPGNEASAKEAEAYFRAAIDSTKGREVEWTLNVKSVTRDGLCTIAPIDVTTTVPYLQDDDEIHYRRRLELSARPVPRKGEAVTSDLGFPVSGARAADLSGGEVVTVRGVVSSVFLGDHTTEIPVKPRLRINTHISPIVFELASGTVSARK